MAFWNNHKWICDIASIMKKEKKVLNRWYPSNIIESMHFTMSLVNKVCTERQDCAFFLVEELRVYLINLIYCLPWTVQYQMDFGLKST